MSTHLASKSATHSHFYSAVNANRGGNSTATPSFSELIKYNHNRASVTIQNNGSNNLLVRLDDVEGQPVFTVVPNQYLNFTPASTISVASAGAPVAFAWMEETVRR